MGIQELYHKWIWRLPNKEDQEAPIKQGDTTQAGRSQGDEASIGKSRIHPLSTMDPYSYSDFDNIGE